MEGAMFVLVVLLMIAIVALTLAVVRNRQLEQENAQLMADLDHLVKAIQGLSGDKPRAAIDLLSHLPESE